MELLNLRSRPPISKIDEALVSPLFGMAFAGFIIAIGLLIAGIEMVTAGATGRGLNLPSKDNLDSLTGKK